MMAEYAVPEHFFDGYDPDCAEWRCLPGELEAYPDVAKECIACGKLKDLREFNRERLGKFKRKANCRSCETRGRVQSYAAN